MEQESFEDTGGLDFGGDPVCCIDTRKERRKFLPPQRFSLCAIAPSGSERQAEKLWNVNNGLLTGVMVGVYELLLLPAVDWSLQKGCR